MRWGFHRSFNAAINNARSDKLASGMWADALRERRCVIPVSVFYEWGPGVGGRKQAHEFRHPDDDYLWVAGLWETDRELCEACRIKCVIPLRMNNAFNRSGVGRRCGIGWRIPSAISVLGGSTVPAPIYYFQRYKCALESGRHGHELHIVCLVRNRNLLETSQPVRWGIVRAMVTSGVPITYPIRRVPRLSSFGIWRVGTASIKDGLPVLC